MTPVRLEPAAPRSQVKHSTTEPLRSLMRICSLQHHYFVLTQAGHKKILFRFTNLVAGYQKSGSILTAWEPLAIHPRERANRALIGLGCSFKNRTFGGRLPGCLGVWGTPRLVEAQPKGVSCFFFFFSFFFQNSKFALPGVFDRMRSCQ